jgi:hypothetical protein
MAVDTTLKSVAITNRQTTPRVFNNPGVGAPGALKSVSSSLASVTAALSITSVIRMVEVPAHCYLKHVFFASAAQGAGAFDIGLYRTNADGGAVIDQDFFASAIDCASLVKLADVIQESAVHTVADFAAPLWSAAGVTAPGPAPGTMYDIALVVTGTDVTTGTGAVYLEAQYV